MNKSESVGKLALALSKLQGEIQNLAKDKAGYGYKYVELSSILDEVRPLLLKNELAVSQLCESSYAQMEGKLGELLVGVETTLMHSSGEWISSTLHMPVTPKGMSLAQASGSVITYARRYALAALLGIAQVDDDAGNQHDELLSLIEKHKLHAKMPIWLEHFKVKHVLDLNNEQLAEIIELIKKNVKV